MDLRTQLMNQKKILPKICVPLEAILRAKMEAAEDPKKAAKLDEKVSANRAIVEEHISNL